MGQVGGAGVVVVVVVEVVVGSMVAKSVIRKINMAFTM